MISVSRLHTPGVGGLRSTTAPFRLINADFRPSGQPERSVDQRVPYFAPLVMYGNLDITDGQPSRG
jgi:hypothetical protein